MGIVGLLKGLDKLGHTYTLNIGDNPEKKTVLGGILWVLGVLLILAYAVNAVVSYSQREKMSTSEDTEDSYMGIPVELGQERLYPMFMVKSLTKFLEEEEVNKMFRITFELTVKNSSSVPPTYFDVVPCRQISPERIEFSKQSVENFKYFENMFQTVMFCVDPKGKKAILSGSPDGLVNTTYSNLMFKPCLSTTEGCRQDVDFRGISVSLIKVNRVQNLHNLTSPVKYFWNFEDDFYITRSKEQRLRMFLMQTEVYDQKGFPYRKELAKRFHQIEKQYRMLQDRDNLVVCEPNAPCDPYLSFVMTSGGKSVKITRTYKSFAEVLGEIGGFRTIVMLGILFLFKYSNSGSEEATLVEHVYGLKPKTSHHFSCCKKRNKDDPNREPGTLSVAAINWAYASIMKTLDIKTIVREISMVKVISLALLSERQHAVVPWAMVNADMKLIVSKLKAKEKKEDKSSFSGDEEPENSNTTLVQNIPDEESLPTRARRNTSQEDLMLNLKILEEPDPQAIVETIKELETYNQTEGPGEESPQADGLVTDPGSGSFQHKFNTVLKELLKKPILLPSSANTDPT